MGRAADKMPSRVSGQFNIFVDIEILSAYLLGVVDLLRVGSEYKVDIAVLARTRARFQIRFTDATF